MISIAGYFTVRQEENENAPHAAVKACHAPGVHNAGNACNEGCDLIFLRRRMKRS